MRKIKEIIRLKNAGLSNRQIAGSCAVSPSTVSEVFHRAIEMDLALLDAESLAHISRVGHNVFSKDLFQPNRR